MQDDCCKNSLLRLCGRENLNQIKTILLQSLLWNQATFNSVRPGNVCPQKHLSLNRQTFLILTFSFKKYKEQK